jgi:hypothetical protein
MQETPRFTITYGRTDFFAEEGLRTLFVASVDEVKQLATQFITVIPDDLADYQDEIAKWDGEGIFTITHQDDDTFLFQATPIHLSVDFTSFRSFVADFRHDDGDWTPGIEEGSN